MANDDPLMSQDEIERLFSQTKEPAGTPSTPGPAKTPPAAPARASKDDQPLAQDDIEKLLSESGRAAAGRRAARRRSSRLPHNRQGNRISPRRTSNISCAGREGPGIGQLGPAG